MGGNSKPLNSTLVQLKWKPVVKLASILAALSSVTEQETKNSFFYCMLE